MSETEFERAAETLETIIALKQGQRFQRTGWRGVAWYYHRPLIHHPDEFETQEDADDHWADQRAGICGCPESGDHFYGVMVGDDREFLVDFEDVELIDDDDYCGGCGQIGCTAEKGMI